MFNQKYTRDQKVWACKNHLDNKLTVSQLAEKLGTTYNSLRILLKDWLTEFKLLGEEKAFLPKKATRDYSESERIALVKDYLASGLEIAEFSVRHEITPYQLRYWLSKYRRQAELEQNCDDLHQVIEQAAEILAESADEISTSSSEASQSSEPVNEKPFKSSSPVSENTALSKERIFERYPVSSELVNEAASASKEPVFDKSPASREGAFEKGSVSREPVFKNQAHSSALSFEREPVSRELVNKNLSGSRDRSFNSFNRPGAPFFESPAASRNLRFKRGPYSQNPAFNTSPASYNPRHGIKAGLPDGARPEALITSLYASSGGSQAPSASDIPTYNRGVKEGVIMARKSYPQELKDRAVTLFCTGVKIADIAQSLGVTYQNVHYWVTKYKKDNGIVVNPKAPPEAAPGFPIPEIPPAGNEVFTRMSQLEEQIKTLQKQLNDVLKELAQEKECSRQKDLIIAAQKKTFLSLQKSLVLSQFKDGSI